MYPFLHSRSAVLQVSHLVLTKSKSLGVGFWGILCFQQAQDSPNQSKAFSCKSCKRKWLQRPGQWCKWSWRKAMSQASWQSEQYSGPGVMEKESVYVRNRARTWNPGTCWKGQPLLNSAEFCIQKCRASLIMVFMFPGKAENLDPSVKLPNS